MSWSDIFFTLHFSSALIVALRVIYVKSSSSAALAWLAMLFAFPLFGVLAYLLIGEPRLGRARAKRFAELVAFHDELSAHFLPPRKDLSCEIRFHQVANLVEKDAGFFALHGNQTQILHDTDAIVQSFIADINAARHCCLLEFYIVEASGRAQQVLEALMQAAKRGVRCQLLADSLGSKHFWRSAWPQQLRDAGVEVTEALPVGLRARGDLRNHRKILVVDYQVAYTGSYNLVDPRLFKQDAGVGEWVDAVMRCEGLIAEQLAAVFYGDWAVENAHNLETTLSRLKQYKHELPISRKDGQETGALLQTIPSQPGGDCYLVYETLINILNVAQEEVLISTPYFVPDEALLNTLITTVKRGVAVTLIIPEKVDSGLVRYASRAYYRPLLMAGVNIQLFGGGLLHTKAVVIDKTFALFGTVNMDMRSFYLNLEVSLGLYDKSSVEAVRALVRSYLPSSTAVELSRWEKRKWRWFQRFIEHCVRLASPLL